MSMASGYIAVCLLEIPEGNLAVDFHYAMGPHLARKMVRVHPAGSQFSSTRRNQMLSRGIRLLWIKTEDEETFLKNAENTRPRLIELAQCLFDACICADTIAMEEATIRASFEIICRWMHKSGALFPKAWTELSQITLAQSLSTHASRVATLAMLFAMSFEHEDMSLLADLALAGFLHDLGKLKQGIPFEAHPHASREMVERLDSEIAERTRLWIEQHHERFGGGGFPLGLEGYKVNDISQILAAADLLDKLAWGRWDGISRGLRGAFETLEKLDREKTFPQYFNPDLFKALLGWSKRTKSPARSAAA